VKLHTEKEIQSAIINARIVDAAWQQVLPDAQGIFARRLRKTLDNRTLLALARMSDFAARARLPFAEYALRAARASRLSQSKHTSGEFELATRRVYEQVIAGCSRNAQVGRGRVFNRAAISSVGVSPVASPEAKSAAYVQSSLEYPSLEAMDARERLRPYDSRASLQNSLVVFAQAIDYLQRRVRAPRHNPTWIPIRVPAPLVVSLLIAKRALIAPVLLFDCEEVRAHMRRHPLSFFGGLPLTLDKTVLAYNALLLDGKRLRWLGALPEFAIWKEYVPDSALAARADAIV